MKLHGVGIIGNPHRFLGTVRAKNLQHTLARARYAWGIYGRRGYINPSLLVVWYPH